MKTLKTPFFIAEISANHCGKLSLAKKLIHCAKINGAHAVKIQTYTADSMTLKSNKRYFKIDDGLWKGYQLWDLYDQAHTPLKWHKKLFDYAKKIGIILFSTPFDEHAVDYLEKLNCPMYKISSFEMTDLLLIKKVAKTLKPLIISTGMASLNEIEKTYATAKKNGAKDITLLYCVSNYPAELDDFNINNIKVLKEKFKCKVGLSDHSNDTDIARTAIAAGAVCVEKHIALDNQKEGPDIKFSLKGKEIRKFVNVINSTYKLLGTKVFSRSGSELKMRKFRRSIFATKDIKKGDKFNEKNIKRIRPGHGISPEFYSKLVGKISPHNYSQGEPIRKKTTSKLNIK